MLYEKIIKAVFRRDCYYTLEALKSTKLIEYVAEMNDSYEILVERFDFEFRVVLPVDIMEAHCYIITNDCFAKVWLDFYGDDRFEDYEEFLKFIRKVLLSDKIRMVIENETVYYEENGIKREWP